MDGYLDLLRVLQQEELVENVAPIQLAIRLLIPEGSRMLELPEVRQLVGRFDPVSLTHPWAHPDPAVAALQRHPAPMVICSREKPSCVSPL